ncbi:unnamed protein product [Cercospora beticola]|nr:unnamed protein product [Cercospora beticola]
MLLVVLIALCFCALLRYLVCHSSLCDAVPGPWIASNTSLWIRWQRWNGCLSLEADKLLAKYGPIVKIAPDIVLVNDLEVAEKMFSRKDLDTSPPAIRALRVGGHEWTVTHPQFEIARQRRHPTMIASTTNNLKLRHQLFSDNIDSLIRDIGSFDGPRSEDIVRHLRICLLKNSLPLMGGSGIELDSESFPHVVGEYNFLVVWRLCLPEWTFSWLKFSPFPHASFRVNSSDALFHLGAKICQQAEKSRAVNASDNAPNVYSMFLDPEAKYPCQSWTEDEISAELAGQILAATETTTSALAYIYYELAKNHDLLEELYEELRTVDEDHDLSSLKLLDACIREGLRFRPPVALTGSRLVPPGGLDVLGYHLEEGTAVTTQSLSLSRQRKDMFPDYDCYNPKRWLEEERSAERRRLLAPFGVGARRCPGANMAIYQMRLILHKTIRAFNVEVAPETTPEKMAPFKANGYRSRHDRCDLIFVPRASGMAG